MPPVKTLWKVTEETELWLIMFFSSLMEPESVSFTVTVIYFRVIPFTGH